MIWTSANFKPEKMMNRLVIRCFCGLLLVAQPARAFVPFLDGGTDIPRFYQSWFDDKIAKQATTAVQKAIGAGNKKVEVNFPPVPNVDEVRFGTPLNKKFGQMVARDLAIPGGYKPGSDISRQLIAFSNIHWAKKICSGVGGGLMGKSVSVVTAEPVTTTELKKTGGLGQIVPLALSRGNTVQKGGPLIAINPGGEETWDRLQSTFGSASPLVVLNNAYSTTYGLGNQRGYEEAYYLKRVSKGWIFRAYPGPWKAFLEKPDGKCELLESYAEKPLLKDVATLVREESFKRYAINNDRWTPGFGERL